MNRVMREKMAAEQAQPVKVEPVKVERKPRKPAGADEQRDLDQTEAADA